jgi:putative two-component system response regulator
MSRAARLLLVDDLPQNLEILCGLLEPEGYALELAQDGQQAVEMALKSPPDLILMDVSMPRLSGLEACRMLKADERTRFVPIVLITALSAREDRIAGIAAGCDDFLSKPVDFEELLARSRSLLRQKDLVDELETAENVLVSLANALEAKDLYTRGHSERVATYAEELGGAMGLPRAERRNLKRAGLLHDLGKIGIPLEYLNKPGPLTTAEYEEVKRHPAISFDICRPLRTMAPLLTLIRGHHERLDGRGYPDGLRGDEVGIPLRCLTIADVYDALTSDRAYRKALPLDKALEIMRQEASVGMWDVRVIDTFANIVLKVGAPS